MSELLKSLLVVGVLAAGFNAAVSARQAPPSAPAVADEEEVFDDKLRDFGYWSGAAFACVAADKLSERARGNSALMP